MTRHRQECTPSITLLRSYRYFLRRVYSPNKKSCHASWTSHPCVRTTWLLIATINTLLGQFPMPRWKGLISLLESIFVWDRQISICSNEQIKESRFLQKQDLSYTNCCWRSLCSTQWKIPPPDYSRPNTITQPFLINLQLFEASNFIHIKNSLSPK